MKQISKKLSIIMLSIGLIGIQNIASAGTLGKSRSYGMQRSSAKYNNNQNNSYNNNRARTNNQPNNNYNNNQQPTNQRNGVGMGGVLTGAALGAAGGYMLGSAMSDNHNNAQAGMANQQQINPNESNQNLAQQQQNNQAQDNTGVANQGTMAPSQSQFPWGVIAILAFIFAMGMMYKKKKSANTVNQTATNGYQPNQNTQNNFDIPNIKQNSGAYVPGQYSNNQSNNGFASPQSDNNQQPTMAQNTIERLPDGLESIYFLRQVKGTFLHIQSMNNAENISEIAKYMTPELYEDIKGDILSNSYVADFNNLECNLVDTATENGVYVASVAFNAMVSDEPNMPERKFQEIWNFTKPINNSSAKWLVAGIQQA